MWTIIQKCRTCHQNVCLLLSNLPALVLSTTGILKSRKLSTREERRANGTEREHSAPLALESQKLSTIKHGRHTDGRLMCQVKISPGRRLYKSPSYETTNWGHLCAHVRKKIAYTRSPTLSSTLLVFDGLWNYQITHHAVNEPGSSKC